MLYFTHLCLKYFSEAHFARKKVSEVRKLCPSDTYVFGKRLFLPITRNVPKESLWCLLIIPNIRIESSRYGYILYFVLWDVQENYNNRSDLVQAYRVLS